MQREATEVAGSVWHRARHRVGHTVADLKDALYEKPLAGTLLLRAFGLTKIPMLLFIGPSVMEMSDERLVVRVPLNRRTKNHLGAMYIGALVAGADVAGGITAMRSIHRSGRNVHLLFKDLKCDFRKRVEGDCCFTCTDGPEIAEAVDRAIQSGERVNYPMNVIATVPDVLGDEPVANFVLTLTLKCRD